MVSDRPVPLGDHILGMRYERKGTRPDNFTPTGEAVLYIDENPVGSLDDMRTQPTVFSGVGEGVRVGRDGGQSVSPRYHAPFPFTGGIMHQVVEDVSGKPYLDLEMAAAAAFSRD